MNNVFHILSEYLQTIREMQLDILSTSIRFRTTVAWWRIKQLRSLLQDRYYAAIQILSNSSMAVMRSLTVELTPPKTLYPSLK